MRWEMRAVPPILASALLGLLAFISFTLGVVAMCRAQWHDGDIEKPPGENHLAGGLAMISLAIAFAVAAVSGGNMKVLALAWLFGAIAFMIHVIISFK